MVSTPPHTHPLPPPPVICNSQAISSAWAQCPTFGGRNPRLYSFFGSLPPPLKPFHMRHPTCILHIHHVYILSPVQYECIPLDIQFWVSKPPPLLILWIPAS